MPQHTKKERAKNRKIKRKIQPVEGRKKGRKVKVAKDVFVEGEEKKKPPVVEAGKEFQALESEAKRIASRKFRVPKPESLTEREEEGGISEGEGDVELAPITVDDIAPLTKSKGKKRKVKRKKKK